MVRTILMAMNVIVGEGRAEVAAAGAEWIARRLRSAVRLRGAAHVAFSGGSTPRPMLQQLASIDLPWNDIHVYQVDERAAPDGHEARNLGLLAVLPVPPANLAAMDAAAADLGAAAGRYAARLPARFDVVHLGMGSDGHTASWPPGLDIAEQPGDVTVCPPFNGWQRLTLTARPVNAARARIVEIVGADKAPMVQRWFLGDTALPMQRVRRTNTTVLLDTAAAAQLHVSAG
jgi:6-phosphogluconolactonase/glucosamine-6-phosphate isomerase/deaminase